MPRDRIPCLVEDLNGLGLFPGYYTNGRLSGSFKQLPLYAVGAAGAPSGGLQSGATGGAGGGYSSIPGTSSIPSVSPVGTIVNLPGLTQTQFNTLVTNLSPQQISVLSNLNACQLQVLLTLTTPQLQLLTGTLTPYQLTSIVTNLTPSLLQTLVSTLTITQLQLLGNLTPVQVQNLITTTQIIGGNVTISQIATLINQLTTVQLGQLTTYDPPTMASLITSLPITGTGTGLQAMLGGPVRPIPPSPISGLPSLALGATGGYPYISTTTGKPTGTPSPLPTGYAPFIVDTSGFIWFYIITGNLGWVGTTLTSSGSGATGPAWTKVTKTFTDFSTGSTSNTITLRSMGAKEVLHAVICKHSTSFSGGAIIAYSVAVGVSGNNGKYINLFDVKQAVSNTAIANSGSGGSQSSDVLPEEINHGGWTLQTTATSSGANLNAATQGSCDFWLLTSTLP